MRAKHTRSTWRGAVSRPLIEVTTLVAHGASGRSIGGRGLCRNHEPTLDREYAYIELDSIFGDPAGWQQSAPLSVSCMKDTLVGV